MSGSSEWERVCEEHRTPIPNFPAQRAHAEEHGGDEDYPVIWRRHRRRADIPAVRGLDLRGWV